MKPIDDLAQPSITDRLVGMESVEHVSLLGPLDVPARLSSLERGGEVSDDTLLYRVINPDKLFQAGKERRVWCGERGLL